MTHDAGDDDERVAALFERVLEVPRYRRRTFLDEVCPGDARLRAEVSALLASHDTAPDFLDRIGEQVLPPALEVLASDLDGVGATVGHYEIHGRLGGGGMGEVFKARDLELGRDVVLKFLPAHLSADGSAQERLRQEARIASALDHPNIAVVYEIGTAEATPSEPLPRTFIAMAYCGQETLADELERSGQLPLGRALDCAIQLADAVSSAHGACIVHRDIKPANLMVDARGSLKLIDFGLSTRGGRADDTGARGGTVAYMSPEQIASGTADPRADIWATGVVLYEMLAGVRPFRGEDSEQITRAIRREPPPPLRTVRPDVPPRLAEVVHRCLAKDPAGRYGSAAALLTDLRTALDTLPIGAGGASLVVMPFQNMTGDAASDYICDGFVEEIVADLSRVRALSVIAVGSSRRLKGLEGSDREPTAVARDLGVGHVLEGRIDVQPDTLQVTASLIDARTGARTCSVSLTGTADDLPHLRQEVARAAVGGLGLTAHPSTADGGAPAITDARAYEAYLRARYEAWRFSADGLARARRYIETALGIVGDNSLLYGTLGHIIAMHGESGLRASADVVRQVDDCANRVFALTPRSAQGHWLKAWAAFRRGAPSEAIRSGERAHALESDNPDVLLLLGYLYAHAGRNAEGRALLERALLLDPLTPLTQAVQGFIPILEGRFADAVVAYRRGFDMDPESPFLATFFGWALAYDRRILEATRILHGVAERFPDTVFAAYASSLAHGLQGRCEDAVRAITPALEAAARENEMFARELAHCFSIAGEHQRALDWLERAVDLGMWNHAYLAEHDWFLDELRGEPRFTALLQRVKRSSASMAS